jgi:AAA+ ATPase superfamily predicted ATPase
VANFRASESNAKLVWTLPSAAENHDSNYKTGFSMQNQIIGRKREQKRLQDLYDSGKAEFVAIYGRRRVGKTFLVRQMFGNEFVFDLAGLANANTKEQLVNFTISLNHAVNQPFKTPKNWLFAFEQLRSVIENSQKERKVIFIDEISWLDTARSGFLTALEHFWNGWACSRNDIMLVVCGSSTSWIMNKLVNNHGGLHNRLTAHIYLQPFTLAETEQYFQSQNIEFSRYDIAECYMIMGGIPYYLSKIQKGLSVAQNIDNLFFTQNAELKNEFQNLYASLFKNYADYIKIVEALSTKAKGLTRKEIESVAQLSSGGGLTTALKNLEYCGFIRAYHSFGKKKYEQLYQLLDSYTLFYFKYLAQNKNNDENFWTNSLNTPQHNAWAGYAFEILALQHVSEIKRALEIGGVQTTVSAWRSENSTPAAQIDLVIDRKDGIIDLCEIKFAKNQFVIDKDYEENLRNKISAFISENKTRKAIHLLMLTTYGISKNKYSGIVQKEVILDNFFVTGER